MYFFTVSYDDGVCISNNEPESGIVSLYAALRFIIADSSMRTHYIVYVIYS